jgi:hypothetical protein
VLRRIFEPKRDKIIGDIESLGFEFFPLSGILENRIHDVSENGSVSVLR